MTAKNAPKPLKSHARASVNSLIAALENLYECSKGRLALETTMQDRAAAGAALPTELPVERQPVGPLAPLLEDLRDRAETLLQRFADVPEDLVLPRVSTGAGSVHSIQGRMVVPAKHAAEKFVALFGADPRKVEHEFEDELGERRVKIEGFANSVSRAYVVVSK